MTGSNHSYKVTAIAVCAIAALLFGLLTSQTHAATIASETFDSVTGFGNDNDIGNHDTNFGVPTLGDGADSALWLGARMENGDGEPDEDPGDHVGVLENINGNSGGPAGRVSDDVAMALKLDLTLYVDVELDFDWRTFAGSSDEFVVAYYTVNPGAGRPDLGAPNGLFDWYQSEAGGVMDTQGQTSTSWYDNNWNEVFRDNGNTVQSENVSLPLAGGNVTYIAFWLDNGTHDLGKFDNVVVSGTLIPEPTSVALVLSASLLLTCKRRRR